MTAVELPVSVPTSSAGQADHLFRGLLRNPLAVASMVFLALVVVMTIIGPLIAPHDPNSASLEQILSAPSPSHLLGTDSAGRDVLSRLLAATQITILGALVAVVVALVLGVATGLIAGYYQGWFDSVASWATSLVMALPAIVVLLAARAVVGPSIWIAMVIFGVLLAPGYFRLVYTMVTVVRTELFVDAARVSGLSDFRIIARHILSVVRAPIIIQTAIVAVIAIAVQSGLEFLGLGDSSVPTWGSMLNDAFAAIYTSPILMLWPSLAIGLTSITLVLLANAMRDVLERSQVVRRKRRRSVTTRTGSVTTFTRAIDVVSSHDDEKPADEPVRHADDKQAAGRQSEIALSIRDLRIGYDQSSGDTIEVVRGISMDIRKGEVHGLIGESGSGKSQTAFAVLGLLPKGGRVTAGTIDYEGIRLDGATEKTYSTIRGRRIAYIPQEPMSNLDASFTIGSQLTEPLRVALGLSKSEARDKALSLLERVGIPQPIRTFKSYPFEVSGGMAQRVLIAGAVSTEPDLIIADEPTTALDVTVQAEVLDLLRDLQEERHMSMLLVTHNFGVVADLCDRVTVMRNGLFVETGPVRAILQRAKHPYTKSLLASILDEGPARPPLAASISKVSA